MRSCDVSEPPLTCDCDIYLLSFTLPPLVDSPSTATQSAKSAGNMKACAMACSWNELNMPRVEVRHRATGRNSLAGTLRISTPWRLSVSTVEPVRHKNTGLGEFTKRADSREAAMAGEGDDPSPILVGRDVRRGY